MSAIRSSADNALAESFDATFQRETLQGRNSWPSEHDVPSPAGSPATTPDANTSMKPSKPSPALLSNEQANTRGPRQP